MEPHIVAKYQAIVEGWRDRGTVIREPEGEGRAIKRRRKREIKARVRQIAKELTPQPERLSHIYARDSYVGPMTMRKHKRRTVRESRRRNRGR